MVRYLMDRFGFTGLYGIEIFREHYGLIFNKFAKWILDKGGKMYVKNKGNKAVLWVDDSRKDDIGLKEFEGSDPLTVNAADKYFESHEETGWKVTPSFVLKAINGVTQNQVMFDSNFQSHLQVIKQLGEAVDRLTEEVSKLKNEKNYLNKP